MEFNVNVNVKLGLDSESVKLACMLFKSARMEEVACWPSETPKPKPRKKKEPVATEAEATPAAPTSFDPKDPSPIQTVTGPEDAPTADVEPDATASDLPFHEAEEKPLPFVAIWNPEDARKARKRRMEEIEDSVPADIKDDVHKQMVKITKLYLNSAAYEHKRDDMGNALNADGLPVKKLDELNSNETLRFMYLCESMHYDDVQKKVFPFEHLEECLDDCPDWETVERAFVISYNKK